MREGDIVLIDTGWWRHVNTDRYRDHPFLTAEAAEWLVAQGAKLVGMDNSSPTRRRTTGAKDYDSRSTTRC